ncbi:hypothetical protein BH09VER1_BH09VER1_51580 [soil metagenome]
MARRLKFGFRFISNEPLSLERLRTILSDENDILIAGACGEGLSAVEVVRRTPPDLVFLDNRMPGNFCSKL